MISNTETYARLGNRADGYAIDGKNIILIDTLEANTMDLEEFEASLDAIGLALAQHYRSLSKFRVKK